LKATVFLLCAVAVGGTQAHGFEERYDLPVPLVYVVAAACIAVGMTFLAAVLFAGRRPARPRRPWGATFTLPEAALWLIRALSWLIFLLTIAAALWGSRDPLMNLAPTLVWIVWWVGLSFLCALVGGAWTVIDPWRTSFDMLDALARRLGRPAGLTLGWHWPAALGQWPAVALLLTWCAGEIVFSLPSSPFKLGCAAVLWTAVNLCGMGAFGRAKWQSNADMFSLVFATLGRMAPLRLRTRAQRPDGAAARAPFVMAMLATVIFDSLHGGQAWSLFEGAMRRVVPQLMDINGVVSGISGLVCVWALFLLAYTGTLRLSLALMPWGRVMPESLVLTLVPIALAYNVAHNFSSLLIQGQRVFQLLSDPFGWQWDLFGIARWYPDIAFVDARMTWFVAVTAIVAGHVASIWWSHRVFLGAGVPPGRAARAMLPMSLLMLAYTAVSMVLIAEPMVAAAP
jgi:hypothetical protein